MSNVSMKSNTAELYSELILALRLIILISVSNNESLSSFEFKFEYSDNKVLKLACVQKGEVDNSVYVRDNIIYMNVNEVIGKYEIDNSEHKSLSSTYSFKKYFDEPLKYRNDEKFFNNLELVKKEDFTNKENCKLTFSLNLKTYDGSMINLIGKESVELVLTIASGKIVTIIYQAVDVEGTKSIKVDFLGSECNIDYPSEIDDYPDMQ